ncbi:hypothetical protein RHMOL_Rhmol12G0083300 [Rhododendron molle]|uniref:Uncharacterized protein n=1 Tax=Rhododendron molle TaxID=49168 RepID=A0ACC0LG46_RHOML|nr:hypothetical protein RHMOL_Rhmol12G0083300 [Rhododendron molle]
MISNSLSPQLDLSTIPHRFRNFPHIQNRFQRIKANRVCPSNLFAKLSEPIFLQKSVVPFAASIAILFFSNPAKAGFLSGFPGIESVPGPELPKIEFLSRFNGLISTYLCEQLLEENQKKYAEDDARIKESPIVKKLLEQSKLNKEKNKQEILDKYCLRGAEWGVGDCSAEGMTPDDRDKFIAMLKQKVGVE